MNLRRESGPAKRGNGGGLPAASFLTAVVAAALQVCLHEVTAVGRGTAEAAFARQLAIYLIHTLLGLSLSQSGAALSRDRTTAAHACRAIEERREDPRLDSIIDLLERVLGTAVTEFAP